MEDTISFSVSQVFTHGNNNKNSQFLPLPFINISTVGKVTGAWFQTLKLYRHPCEEYSRALFVIFLCQDFQAKIFYPLHVNGLKERLFLFLLLHECMNDVQQQLAKKCQQGRWREGKAEAPANQVHGSGKSWMNVVPGPRHFPFFFLPPYSWSCFIDITQNWRGLQGKKNMVEKLYFLLSSCKTSWNCTVVFFFSSSRADKHSDRKLVSTLKHYVFQKVEKTRDEITIS